MNALSTGTVYAERSVRSAGWLSPVAPWAFAISMKAGTADLPDDTNSKKTFTRTQNIGRLVAAALDLETCDEKKP